MAAEKAASPTRAWSSIARAHDKQGAGSDHRRADQGRAKAAGVAPSRTRQASENSVESAESSVGESFFPGQDMQAMRAALEAAGVEFTNGDEPGVKLKATKTN
jgi:hypothetical protein